MKALPCCVIKVSLYRLGKLMHEKDRIMRGTDEVGFGSMLQRFFFFLKPVRHHSLCASLYHQCNVKVDRSMSRARILRTLFFFCLREGTAEPVRSSSDKGS